MLKLIKYPIRNYKDFERLSMRFILVILLMIGCNVENNTVSITANTSNPKSPVDVNNNPTGEEEVQTNENSGGSDPAENSSTSNSSLTFTPKGASAGDDINLNSYLSILVTANNTSGSEATGSLNLSGADASKLELVNVSGFTPNGDGLTYTIAAGETARFLVVRKSDYSDSLTATIQDNSQDVVNISSVALGFNILYWLNPRDVSFSNVNDSDSSGDLSNGDTLNTLPDRSGNNYFLTKNNSTNMATFISSGQNGHPNVDVNAWIGGGNNYQITLNHFLPITSGDDIMFITSLATDSLTQRQDFKFYNPGYASSPYWYNDIYGIDLNTYMTAGQKHGMYIAGVSFDANKTLTTNPENTILYMSNTFAGNSITANTTYFVNNNSYALDTRRVGAYSNGGFYSFLEQAKIINFRMNAKVYDAMIINASEISEAQRNNLNCYIALKNNIDNASCL